MGFRYFPTISTISLWRGLVLPGMSNYPLAPSVGTLAGTQEPKFTMDAAHR